MLLHQVEKPEAKLYNTQEVADFMGVPYMHVYRLVQHGKLKAINLGTGPKRKVYGFRAEDVQAYYDSISNSITGAKGIDE